MDIMHTAINSINEPLWIKDKDDKLVFVNDAFLSFWNLKREDVINNRINDIFPKELVNEFSKNNKKIKDLREKSKFQSEIMGRVVEATIIPIYENGEYNGVIGYFYDITHQKEIERAIEKQYSLLNTLINTIPDVIFYKDINSRYMMCNRVAVRNFLGSDDPDKLIGKSDIELYGDTEMTRGFVEDDKKIMERRELKVTEATFKSLTGENMYMESIKAPVIDNKNDVIGVVGISRNVTDRKNLELKLKETLRIDNLTGLYNRHYFNEKITESAIERQEHISLIMGDVNGLKLVNDAFGHLEGDKLLIAVSDVIKESCRVTDYVFRWGGDEIVILLPDTDEVEVENICKLILETCRGRECNRIPLSISLGTSTSTKGSKSIDKMIKEAEEKLYRQKLLSETSDKNSILMTLQKSLEEKNVETEEHTKRLVDLAVIMGKTLGLPCSEVDELALIANLHDIGKIGIPEEILNKPGKLTAEEYEIMKTHSEKGYRIIKVSTNLKTVANGVLAHHERWDGRGYPMGLSKKEIPLAARIVSIVDAFDAMTNDRVYRKALSFETAMKELEDGAGKQFDPELVELFKNIVINQ